MFGQNRKRSALGGGLSLARLIYFDTARGLRKGHRSAIMSLVISMMQSLIMVLAFYVMFSVLGLRGAALRGDFLLYLMSGIFLFMTHIKTMGAVSGAAGAASPLMQHAPMNTIISVCAAALGALYIQILSIVLILFAYHVCFVPIVIEDPIGGLGMILLAWFSGAAIGLVLYALKPWAPTTVSLFNTIYMRVNMLASGKMFVANTMPGYMLAMFDWNPLFHTIDQARSFIFINYNPHFSSVIYPVVVSCVLLVIGLLAESYTRRHASLSWSAGR